LVGADKEFRDSTVTGTDKEVTVGQELQAVDTLGEESVLRADALEKSTVQVDLNDITSEGAEVSGLVIRRDGNALVDSLDLAQSEVLEEDFLLGVVDVPDADSVVVDGDKFLIGVVVESDLVGDVHANGVTTNGFSTDGFPDYELVVILAAE